MVCEHVQKADQLCGAATKHINLNVQYLFEENKQEVVSMWPGFGGLIEGIQY